MRQSGLRRIGVLGACAVSLVAAVTAAQRPQEQRPQPTFRTAVELVQIDAVVVDERGRHVRGLTANDFRVFDRGKAQAVAAFEEVAHERAETSASAPILPVTIHADVATNQTAQSDRLVVMVVDDLHIWQGRTDTAKTIAQDVLAKLGRDASMAVLFTSGDHSTEVTDDPSRLLSAIETLKGRQSVRRPNQAIDTQSPGRLDPEMTMEQQLAIVQTTQSTNVRQFADNMRLFTTLEEAARLLGTGAGRKAFVLLSEGIIKNPVGIFGSMSSTPQLPEGGAEYVSSGDAAATINPPAAQYHDRALVDMMEAMQRANVMTYAIDPRGEVTSRELALESFPGPVGFGGDDPVFRWRNPIRQAQDGLATIAEASGGFAVVNSDDFTSGVDDIIADLDHYYLLGFYPGDTKGDGFRRVRVEVPGHPDWTVRFRRGYVPEPEEKKKSTEEVDPLVALSSGVLPSGALPLRLAAIPLSASGTDTNVVLALEVSVPRVAVEEADRKLRDELTYEVIVVDENKNKAKSGGGMTGRVTLAPREGAGGQLPDTVSYQVADTITLKPGTYQLRVSARSAKLATGGSVYLNLDVPDFTKPDIALSGIAIGYAEGPRVPAARVAPRSGGRGVGGPRSAELTSLPFAPTLDRTFGVSDSLRVYFDVFSRSESTAVRGALDIVNADGTTVHRSMPFVPDADGHVDLRVPLDTLASGAYILRLTVTNAANSAIREVGFIIR